MIKADDLIRWIREYAVSKSITVPNGWIRGKDLLAMAQEVANREPFDFLPPIGKDIKK